MHVEFSEFARQGIDAIDFSSYSSNILHLLLCPFIYCSNVLLLIVYFYPSYI